MSKKKVVIGSLVFVVAGTILCFGLLANKFKTETKKMTPLATGEVLPGVYAIQDDFVNMFLVRTLTGYVGFDAGNDPEKITAGLQALNIEPARVRALFLTHSDADHVAAAGTFHGAVVYLSEAEEAMVDGSTWRAPLMKNRLAVNYSTIKDGAMVTVDGLEVQGLLTPGHTPGSMCFLVNDEFLFTGDTLSLIDGRVGLFNEFFNMDSACRRSPLIVSARFPMLRCCSLPTMVLLKIFRQLFQSGTSDGALSPFNKR